MRLSKILEVKRRKLRNRIFTLGVFITGLLSIAFAVITFYGQNAGNFVMAVDYDSFRRGIILSTSRDFEITTSQLMTEPIEDAREMTYSWLKIEEILQAEGNYVDPDYDYVAYTFYIMNNGFETVDITYHMRMTDSSYGIEDAIRILVIEDDEKETMYQSLDGLTDDGELPQYPNVMPKGKLYLSDTIVFRETFNKFEPLQVKKFSVIVWLEGYDPDTNDDVLGGRVKLQMNFSINKEA